MAWVLPSPGNYERQTELEESKKKNREGMRERQGGEEIKEERSTENEGSKQERREEGEISLCAHFNGCRGCD